MYINMPKQKKIFSIKDKNTKINMNVDEHLYNHFQSLTPAHSPGHPPQKVYYAFAIFGNI